MGYIYKITNKINGKSYIGQTKNPVEVRWDAHIYAAKRENDINRQYLHRAIQKDGLENFIFEVLEEIPDSLLNDKEKYWIKYYHTYRYDEEGNQGYNLTLGGEGNWKFDTDTLIQAFYEHNEHLGNTCKDVGCSEVTLIKALKTKNLYGKGAFTPVYQISLDDGHIVKEYQSVTEAASDNHVTIGSLENALNGKLKTVNHFAWSYKDKYKDFKLEEHIDNKYQKVQCLETNIIFNTVKEAGKWVYDNGYTTSYHTDANICRACKRKIKAYGFHWQYV